jgi:Recombinase
MARWHRKQRRADRTRRQPQPSRPPRPALSPAEPRPSTQPDATASQPKVVVREAAYVERLAYTRTQAAAALGISRSTLRRLLPYLDTIEMPWGGKLIPVDELERLVTERRRPAVPPRPAARPGRKPSIPPDVVQRIRNARAAGRTLRQIAADLNASGTATAHGGAQWWPSTVRAVLRRAD